MAQSISTKKAQVWYIDFMVGIMIFIIVIVIYFEYINNLSEREENIVDDLIINSKAISNSLVSEGYPSDWNSTNVVRIGITDNNQRINKTKLERYINMSYIDTKTKFRTPYNYYIFLEYKNGSKIQLNNSDYYGYQYPNAKRLVQITRRLIYESEIVRMGVQVWQ